MRRHWLKISLLGVLALTVLLLTLVFTVMRTETGAGWVLDIMQNQLDGVEFGAYSGSLHDGLTLQNVGFDTPDFSLQFDSLSLAVRTEWLPFVLRLEWLEVQKLKYQVLTASEEPEPASVPESIDLPFPLDLPRITISGIEVLDQEADVIFQAQSLLLSAYADELVLLHNLDLAIEQGKVVAKGQIALQKPFAMSLDLEPLLAIPVEDEQKPLLLDLSLDVMGSLEGLDLKIDGTVDPPGFQLHSLTAESRLALTGMETEFFEVEGPDLRVSGSSAVEWENFRTSFQDVHLEIPGTDFKADADLTLDLESDSIAGQVAWSDLTWPLRDEVVQWTSKQGDIRLSGSFDQWAVDGTLDAEASGYPGGQLQIDVTGDRGGLQGRLVEMTALGGSLQGTGSYRWDDGGAFSAEVELENVATESMLPEYPAVLSGQLSAKGQLEPLSVDLDVQRLVGKVLGKPLAARGRIEIGDGIVRAEDFSIDSGASRVTLDGFPDKDNGLVFEAKIADLGDFLPQTQGQLDASGTLHLRAGWPILDLDAHGNNIAWQDVFLSSLTVNGGSQGQANADHVFDVSMKETRVGGSLLGQVSAQLFLNPDHQALNITAGSGSNRVSAEIAGQLDVERDNPEVWSWAGELGSLDVVLNEIERVSLQEPAVVQVSSQVMRLERGCLLDISGAVTCVEAGWSLASGTKLEARLDQLPLDILDKIFALQLELSQQVSGDLSLTQAPGTKPSGSANFQLTAGAMSFKDDPDPILETGEGALAFTLMQGRLTSGVLDIPITGQGVIDVDYSIPDVTEGLDAELRGTLLIDMGDLDVLSIMLPRADRISGSLTANLELSGTVGQPYFAGRLELQDGVLENRAIGIKLEDINLSGNLLGNGETRLTGGFRAAEGVGELEALVDLRDIQQPRFELGISGKQLKLFNKDDLMVVVDPDLSLALQPGSVTIDGNLHIPSALIAPAIIPEKTVSESSDLVIVAGRPSGDIEEENEAQPLSILGGLKLTLGKDVKLDVTVAKLDVTGAVDFNWQGQMIPMANGNFSLLGEVVAFGQRLEIAQGDISFPGGPADDPHLNIRAERQIYGNSEVRRAGLLVAGTVQRPVVEPYTDPMTNRERAQTLLVTGSDFNMERGVGAVDIGTYIAPRIFVSYGVGVFDDQNVISIRYDLGRGWGVKATSGERQTGVDVSYTLEN